MYKKKLYNTGLVFPEDFVRTFTNFWGEALRIFCCFEKVNFVASFGINTKAAGIVYELHAL